jgi:transcriptional regulator with XRE-family HTH domain
MRLQTLIGARIKQLRESKGVTQEQLAGQARSDAATLSRIETGKQNLSAETLASFVAALSDCPIRGFKQLIDSGTRHRLLWVPTD